MDSLFNILLGSKLDTSQKTISELNKQINLISSQLNKINLKVNIDSSVLNNFSQQFKELNSKLNLNNAGGKISTEYKEQLVLLRRLNKEQDTAERYVVKRTSSLKEQNQLLALQSKYNSQNFKSSVQNLTATPSGIKELNQYFKGLEQASKSANGELIKLQQNADKTNATIRNFGTASHHQRADELTNSLKALNLTQNMTQQEMQETVVRARQLSNQLRGVSTEAQATGKTSMTLGTMLSTAFSKFSV